MTRMYARIIQPANQCIRGGALKGNAKNARLSYFS